MAFCSFLIDTKTNRKENNFLSLFKWYCDSILFRLLGRRRDPEVNTKAKHIQMKKSSVSEKGRMFSLWEHLNL